MTTIIKLNEKAKRLYYTKEYKNDILKFWDFIGLTRFKNSKNYTTNYNIKYNSIPRINNKFILLGIPLRMEEHEALIGDWYRVYNSDTFDKEDYILFRINSESIKEYFEKV